MRRKTIDGRILGDEFLCKTFLYSIYSTAFSKSVLLNNRQLLVFLRGVAVMFVMLGKDALMLCVRK